MLPRPTDCNPVQMLESADTETDRHILADRTVSSHLQDFHEEFQPLVFNKVPTCGWGLISKIPKCTQCKLKSSVYYILVSFLLHNLK